MTDFLDFARPAPVQLIRASLHDVCKRVCEIVHHEAASVGAKLEKQFAPAEYTLRLDCAKIEQALLNLLRNAVDAVATQGGGCIKLRTWRRPTDVAVEIEDDGPGIPSPDAPIFDVFYTTKAEGTGLGLALVHRTVTDHGGSVEVESRPGRTVFRVVLPIPDDAMGPSA